jgi:hypothetical protein
MPSDAREGNATRPIDRMCDRICRYTYRAKADTATAKHHAAAAGTKVHVAIVSYAKQSVRARAAQIYVDRELPESASTAISARAIDTGCRKRAAPSEAEASKSCIAERPNCASRH